ncbi:MAG: hypothetical protein V2J89_02205 [Halieaceae bacterium]|jgi:hypothetical protein|nr:hypothetical protein [Halieaceae bacterium]
MKTITRNYLPLLAGAILAFGLALSNTLSANSVHTPVMPRSMMVSTAGLIPQAPASGRDRAEALFQADWGAAQPAIFSRIATAFSADAMSGADLMAVECRASLCKIRFQADQDVPVSKLLPMQLAGAFNTIVTVHDTGTDGVVYMDVPSAR